MFKWLITLTNQEQDQSKIVYRKARMKSTIVI